MILNRITLLFLVSVLRWHVQCETGVSLGNGTAEQSLNVTGIVFGEPDEEDEEDDNDDDEDDDGGEEYDENDLGLEFARFGLGGEDLLEGFRLPEDVVPLHYDLRIRPIPGYIANVSEEAKWTAPGHVKILVKCVNATSQITLHAVHLNIRLNDTKVTNANTSEAVQISSQYFEPMLSLFTIKLNESLQSEMLYEISVNFSSIVYQSRKDGIYVTYYQDPSNVTQTKALVSTLFAPTQARRAFPCFDEPQLKATFKIAIGRTEGVSTLCNMNRVSSSKANELDGWWWDEFATTVPMSTYLIAIVISEFGNHTNEHVMENRQQVATWADAHYIKKDAAEYGTRVTQKILPFFETYLGFNFSLPKIDSVAMPKISYGGMETWGLIIYKESGLLYFQNHTPEEKRGAITGLIAHELAHQWSGNLVTFKWWSDIWLSEGLATYLQYLAVAENYPEFDSWNRFVTDSFHSALNLDSKSITSHPLHRPILNNDVILTVFDGIAYNKGASVLRMMEYALGHSVFHEGLKNYIRENAYTAVHQDQLFQAFQEAINNTETLPPNTTVKNIMDTWTLQAGYPLIRVSVENSTVFIEQNRYDPENLLLNGSWWVPVTLHLEGSADFEDNVPDLWLTPQDAYATVTLQRDVGEWILVNAASTGFYRVVYDANLTEAIQRQLYLDHSVFPTSARCRIIDDYFTLAEKKLIPIETAMNMISYIGRETDLAVWRTAFVHLKHMREVLGFANEHLNSWINMRLGNALSAIEEDIPADEQEKIPGTVTMRHNFLLSWACQFKLSTCLKLSTNLVSKWKEYPEENAIPVGLRSTVYCAVASEGDPELFEFLSQKYQEEKNEDEKLILLQGLSCAKDMNAVTRTLKDLADSVLDTTKKSTETEDLELKEYLKGAITSSDTGRNVSWAFIKDTFKRAADMNNLDKASMVTEVLSTMGDYWKSHEDKQQLEDFMKMVNEKMGHENATMTLAARTILISSLQAALDKVDNNILWKETFGTRIENWFELENYYFPGGFITK